MDIFLKKHSLVPDNAYNKQHALLENLKNCVMHRKNVTKGIIHNFMKIGLNKPDMDIKKAYKSLFKLNMNKTVNDNDNLKLSADQPLDLLTALVQLRKSANEESMKSIYMQQSAFWANILGDMEKAINTGNEIARKIGYVELEECVSDKIALESDSMSFMLSVVKIDRIFKGETNRHYEECLWVLYNADDEEIKHIKTKINEKWRNMGEEKLTDMFCFNFAELYQILSTAAFHAPELTILEMCKPNSTDYIDYVNFIAADPEMGSMAVVAYALSPVKPLVNVNDIGTAH